MHQVMRDTRGEADPETVACAIEVAKFLPCTVDKRRWLEQVKNTVEQELGEHEPVALLLKCELLKLAAPSAYTDVHSSIPDLQQSLEACIEQRGSQDSLSINARICLGKALVHSPQASEQEQGLGLLHTAIADMTAAYSGEDSHVLGAQLDHLVPSLIGAQQANDATELLSKLRPVCTQVFGAKSLMLVGLLRQHAAACYARDECKRGEDFLREAIAGAKAVKQGTSRSQQSRFVAEQGLYLELAAKVEEQGKYVYTSYLAVHLA